MPVVFVHGVATRAGRDCERAVAARTALTHACLAGPLLRGPGPLSVVDCYWGDLGAEFGWNQATLPSVSSRTETFGPPAELELQPAGEEYQRAPLLVTARQSSLSDALDLLSEAAEASLRGKEAAATAELAERAAAYALRNPHPGWLDHVTDDPQFIGALANGDTAPALEAFGTAAVSPLALARYRESGARLAGALPRAGSTALLSHARRPVHHGVALFLGDVLVYVQQQGRTGALGPVAQRVAAAIEEGDRLRDAGDPHLVVIAHSMGGSICFDLLTRPEPAPSVAVDTFVTVGSQVGLLAELGLFPHVPRPPDAAPRPVRPPAGIGRRLNVYDINDSLSFLAAPVFDGAEDMRYSTGRGLLHAHSSYLSRPGFFLRLAGHLSERQT
ncbi:hypothetical protein ACWEN3_40720 [Streptomyces sp. NPDC004561]